MPRARTPETPVTLSFVKGLDESQETTVLPAGFLAQCTNWVPEPTGGLRTRVGWLGGGNTQDAAETQTYPVTNRQIRGMFYCSDYVVAKSAERRWWAVALINPDASNARQVWVLKDDLSGGWFRIWSTATAVDFATYPMAFCKSAGAMIFSHPAFAVLAKWDLNEDNDNTTIAAMTLPGRALAFHKDRVWSGGSLGTRQARLHYSAAGNDASWNLTTDYIDIGVDSGEAIEDLLPFSGQLLIATRAAVWIMSGGSPATFSLFQLDKVSGSRGRCLIPTPAGVVILGETEAWLWQGGDPVPISAPVRNTYTTYNTGWRTSAYAGGKAYITGYADGHPLMVFDPFTGAWHIEDLPSNNERLTSLVSFGGRLGGGPKQGTVGHPLVYRDLPHGARAKDFAGHTEAFLARTPDFALTKTREPVWVEAAYIQVRQRAGSSASTNKLKVKPYLDGVALGSGQDISPKDSPPKVWGARIPVNALCATIGFEFSHTVPAGGGALYDPEAAIVDVQVEPPR